MEFPSWLEPFQPRVPLKSLVEEINVIFHSFDARNYDAEHLEIRLVWPALWAEMMRQLPQRDCWRILDFGCGTGFEAEQLLQHQGARVDFLLAYDPSREMLGRAKSRLGNNAKVVFSNDLKAIQAHAPYNLLLTNSVLHHLGDVDETIFGLQAFLSKDAYWLAGNEPSTRFYKNAECVQLFQKYAAYRERRKWFQPSAYAGKLKSMLGKNSCSATARAALERGLFTRLPSEDAIVRLVDFHVQQPADDIHSGRGLDLARMKAVFQPYWILQWSRTYSYLGAFNELKAPRHWRKKAHLLKEKFPGDGANFCAVWSRPGLPPAGQNI
jgi:SAM-dependent methyltransferase